MKILFTGGGTGGHFYPLIAVAEAIRDVAKEKKLIEPSLYYAAPEPYDKEALFANSITFVKTSAGKRRPYFSILNFFDLFKTAWGVLTAMLQIFFIYPDVVFSKGGYASFPALFAARFFRIPVVIHESDTIPGKANIWASKFAARIAISYAQAAAGFPESVQANVALTGNPVRKAILNPAREGAHEFLGLEETAPVIFVTGGSQGAQAINDVVLKALPQLLEKYQVIHQTGKNNFTEVEQLASVIIGTSAYKARFHPFAELNELAMRMAYGAADLVITRAGSSLFEVASAGIPAIVIPIPKAITEHQTPNAIAYSKTGAGIVIEQNNLSATLLVSEVSRILDNKDLHARMQLAARAAGHDNAAKIIADELLNIALSHESK